MRDASDPLSTAALFAGIGGIELGFAEANIETALFCEWLPSAQRVLAEQFEGVPVVGDIADLEVLPDVDIVTAGFPCQDLSQAGRTAGIEGERSGLVEHVFRLLDGADNPPTWLCLENVPFMLSLQKGRAMQWLTGELDRRGLTWAYRVVDTRAFGLPQRRRRVILVASQTEDPLPVLFNQEAGQPPDQERDGLACGFYWTEGTRGLGWAVDAIPTLKGGSSLGIPSAPAIWNAGSGEIVTPDLRDAERLQGFPADWTAPADIEATRRTERWKLVGNAVSVPVAAWLGKRLRTDESRSDLDETPLGKDDRWPTAAWGHNGARHRVELSEWPVFCERPHLHEFLKYAPHPLSARATAGFLSRAKGSTLRIPKDLIREAEEHLVRMTEVRIAA